MKKICIVCIIISILITIGYLLKGDIDSANVSIIGLLSILNTYGILRFYDINR